MLTVEQVLRVIAETVQPVASERLLLGKSPGRLVLAEDVKMGADSPRHDRSQLDGFAVRPMDAAVGAKLRLVGQVDAGGAIFSGVVGPGQCVGINTGGLMPAGADGVLMVEMSERIQQASGEFVVVKAAVKLGYGVQKQGSDARQGEVVIKAGTVLGAAQYAACVTAGHATPLVRQVRMAVLSTGDELVEIDAPEPLAAGKIRNSNQLMLCTLAAEVAGAGNVKDLGHTPDEPQRLRRDLERGLAESDLLVVCGGMSMGTRDLVPPMLKEMGFTMDVEKVRIKPGKPFILGTLGEGAKRKYVAGLPGNPVSSFVTFQRFVREVVGRMLGSGGTDLTMVRARVSVGLEENGDREFYLPCAVEWEDGVKARVLKWKGSADIFTVAQANGLIVRAVGAAAVAAGEEVEVITGG